MKDLLQQYDDDDDDNIRGLLVLVRASSFLEPPKLSHAPAFA